MKGFKNYNDFQSAMIERYGIIIENNSKCHSRTHVHVKEKRICKWKKANSIKSTFTLLHEIGHCENNNSKMRRCEQEYFATQWALDKCKEFNINVPKEIIDRYQKYVYRELERGIRRGGTGYLSKNAMLLRYENEAS
nr:hypothetical protein [Clostridia bacterium]